MRKIITTFLLLAVLCGCGYDRFPDADITDIRSTDLIPNADIGLLRESYLGNSLTIVEDVVIEGYVTANDWSGNYFNTFIIQDGTGAVEINAGIADLHNYFQVGRRVVVKAKGLALGDYNDVIQLGRKVNPYSDYMVEEFGSRATLERYVFADTKFRYAGPIEMEFKDLDRAHCGKLVRVGRLLAEPTTEYVNAGYAAADANDGNAAGNGMDAADTWAFPGGGGKNPATGYRRFRDPAGDSLLVVTSGYANFAGSPVPSDTLTLTGILIYGKFNGSKEQFGLKLRDLNDMR